jgi:uncharacterized protein YraI
MKRNIFLLAALLAALLITASCAGAGPQPQPVPPTKTPKPTFTPVPVVVPEILPTATIAPAETAPTAAPVVTPTVAAAPAVTPTVAAPTAAPAAAAPSFTAKQTVNVRGGPGTDYPVVGQLAAGQGAPIAAKTQAGDWVQFAYNGDPAWVVSDLINVTGDIASVKVATNIPAAPAPVAQAPAPPPVAQAPAPTAAPAAPAPTAKPAFRFSLLSGVERCDPNAGSTYFNGVVRHRDNSLYNGVCVHIAFYGPRNTRCSGCDGVGDGNWSFSPFGGPAPAGTQVEIFVVPCPGGMPSGGQTQQTGFGDLTPQSDKWIHTVQQSEQCTGITFVGD